MIFDGGETLLIFINVCPRALRMSDLQYFVGDCSNQNNLPEVEAVTGKRSIYSIQGSKAILKPLKWLILPERIEVLPLRWSSRGMYQRQNKSRIVKIQPNK